MNDANVIPDVTNILCHVLITLNIYTNCTLLFKAINRFSEYKCPLSTTLSDIYYHFLLTISDPTSSILAGRF
jgi:hypothetical protein